ncbi:MAG: hypothetical protein IKY44_06865 [Clostridia bacterium]|nr:hypothetical protein [Clostridia bacterium]
MKSLFQNKLMHIITCVLLFWKGISLVFWFLIDGRGALADFFSSTGFFSPVWMVIIAGFSVGRTALIVALVVGCIAVLAYWTFFVLLATNRSVAGVGSMGILVIWILDLPLSFVGSTAEWWMVLAFVIFNAAIFFSMVVMRRSRQGARDWFERPPKSI